MKMKKREENLIKGCQSTVWLHAEEDNEALSFSADSDAILTKGIVALLLRVFNHQKPEVILSTDTAFIDEIGLTGAPFAYKSQWFGFYGKTN